MNKKEYKKLNDIIIYDMHAFIKRVANNKNDKTNGGGENENNKKTR